jgi:hypothetical protein
VALNVFSPDFTGTGPKASVAAPSASQTVDVTGGDVFLIAVIGGTATTVTATVGPLDDFGRSQTSLSSGSVTNNTIAMRLTRAMGDASGLVTVAFSQVTGVTAWVLRP